MKACFGGFASTKYLSPLRLSSYMFGVLRAITFIIQHLFSLETL